MIVAPIYWWRAESASSACDLPVGVSEADVGSPTYQACKWGNGIFSDSDGNGGRIVEGTSRFTPNLFAMDFYVKTPYALADGVADNYYTQLSWFNGTSWKFIFSFYPAPYKTYFSSDGGAHDIRSAGLTWGENAVTHIYLRHARDASLPGSKTLQIYVNGSVVADSTTVMDDTAGNNSGVLGICGLNTNGSNVTEHGDSTIDNLRIFNYVTHTDADITWLKNHESWIQRPMVTYW